MFKNRSHFYIYPIIISVIWTGGLYIYAWAKMAALHYVLNDTSLFESVLWNTLQGYPLQSALAHGSYLNVHFSPSLIFLVPLYAIGQSPQWLLLLQLTGLALGAPLLYMLAKKMGLSNSVGLILSIAWLFCAPTIGSATFDFHEVTICSSLFILLTLLSIKNKFWSSLVLAVILLGIKEDMGIYIASLGLILVLGYDKHRLGWLLTVIGVFYFITVYFFLWDTLFPQHSQFAQIRFAQFGREGNILAAIVRNPFLLVQPLLNWDRLWALAMLLLPLSLIPLWHRAFLGVIPSLWLFLSLSIFGYGIFCFHYHVPSLALIFIATVPAIIKLKEKLPKAYKISVAAIIPFTLLMHFTIPSEYAYLIYNLSGLKAHPSLNTLKYVFNEPPSVSIATNVCAGYKESNRQNIFEYPGKPLPDIVCSNSAFDKPVTMLLISALGYNLERTDPVFLILSRRAKRDARSYFMERLKWMEAEECDLLSWDLRRLEGARGNHAFYVSNSYAWHDRFVETKGRLLPSGNYTAGLRLACSGKPKVDDSPIYVDVVAWDETNGSRSIATCMIEPTEMESDVLKTFNVPFSLPQGAFLHLIINFGIRGEYWFDGVELNGLDCSFDEYVNFFCKANLKASDGQCDPALLSDSSFISSHRVLSMEDTAKESAVCRWDVPPSLTPGNYLAFCHIRIESKDYGDITWGELSALRPGERLKLANLHFDNLEIYSQHSQLQICRIRVPDCRQIELVVNKPEGAKLEFDQLWMLNLR